MSNLNVVKVNGKLHSEKVHLPSLVETYNKFRKLVLFSMVREVKSPEAFPVSSMKLSTIRNSLYKAFDKKRFFSGVNVAEISDIEQLLNYYAGQYRHFVLVGDTTNSNAYRRRVFLLKAALLIMRVDINENTAKIGITVNTEKILYCYENNRPMYIDGISIKKCYMHSPDTHNNVAKKVPKVEEMSLFGDNLPKEDKNVNIKEIETAAAAHAYTKDEQDLLDVIHAKIQDAYKQGHRAGFTAGYETAKNDDKKYINCYHGFMNAVKNNSITGKQDLPEFEPQKPTISA